MPSGVPFQQKNRALHHILSLCPLEGTSPRLVCWKSTPKGTLEGTLSTIVTISLKMYHDSLRTGAPSEYSWCPSNILKETLKTDTMISVTAFKVLLMKSCQCFDTVRLDSVFSCLSPPPLPFGLLNTCQAAVVNEKQFLKGPHVTIYQCESLFLLAICERTVT